MHVSAKPPIVKGTCYAGRIRHRAFTSWLRLCAEEVHRWGRHCSHPHLLSTSRSLARGPDWVHQRSGCRHMRCATIAKEGVSVGTVTCTSQRRPSRLLAKVVGLPRKRKGATELATCSTCDIQGCRCEVSAINLHGQQLTGNTAPSPLRLSDCFYISSKVSTNNSSAFAHPFGVHGEDWGNHRTMHLSLIMPCGNMATHYEPLLSCLKSDKPHPLLYTEEYRTNNGRLLPKTCRG